MIIEIVILAMVAAFLGLRLYSVLGRRAEHEEEMLGGMKRPDARTPAQVGANDERAGGPGEAQAVADRALIGVPVAVQPAVRKIAAADRNFTPSVFLEGARSAYGMVLEAFWAGDRETLEELCDDDVYAGFSAAIDAREAAGETVENRLVRINEAEIVDAEYDAPMARVTVRFASDIAALTRDKEGAMIAGSLDDAVESHEKWTFSRKVTSSRPNWLVDETNPE